MKPYKKIIGITGGIGTGKSTVSDILMEKGYPVVDADLISRGMYEEGTEVYINTLEEFGPDILDINDEIDRAKLGGVVFSDRDKLKILNSITHSYIMKTVKQELNEELEKNDVAFADIPLLIEGIRKIGDIGLKFTDIVLVYANKNIQLERIMKRDGLSEEEALDRINSQMDIEKKKALVSYIVYNETDKESLMKEVDRMLLDLT